MKRSKLIKILKKHGCQFYKDGSNHEKWLNPSENNLLCRDILDKTFQKVWRKVFSNKLVSRNKGVNNDAMRLSFYIQVGR